MGHRGEELDAFAEWERREWERRAQPYAEGLTGLTRGAAEALLDAADVRPGDAVLDVATGPGVVALAARARGARVIAVDQSDAMVAIALSTGLDVRRAAAEHLPFGDRTFDAVVAGFLLNHLARPDDGVAELARVCRGRVALSVWDTPEANAALGLFGVVADELGLPDAVPPGPDGRLFADEAGMATVLATAGLGDVRVERVRWTFAVEPGAWFDAVAASAPRTGAVVTAATSAQRAELRARYVELARAEHGSEAGLVSLPAAAVVGSGRVSTMAG